MVRRVPKLDRIQDAIDFRPTHDIDQIIKSVIDCQRSRQPAGSKEAPAVR